MKYFFLFFASCLFLTGAALAKGHGGHGGGHSGSHSGGGHASPSHTGSTHPGNGRSSSGAGHSANHISTHTAIVRRATSPRAISVNHQRSMPVHQKGFGLPPRGGEPAVNYGTGYSPGYYGYGYYYPSCYNPFFYDPYYSMFSIGLGMMYSPTYSAGQGAGNDYYADNQDNNSTEELEGYVVYANDTLSGAISMRGNTVFLETADTARGYDYKFKMKNKQLEYVTAYNDDDKQVKLVRLTKSKNKLWRVVHEGKLNLYDDDHRFIYRPEDIDKMSLIAEFNGQEKTLNSFYGVKSKDQLTAYINEAYGLHLDPKNYNWNQLLIYLDKLD